MKNLKSDCSIIFLACVACTLASSASAGTFTFQVADGLWHNNDNWLDEDLNQGTPTVGDIAIIPVSKICSIKQFTRVDEIRVVGTLRICDRDTLQIKNDSSVSGVLEFHSCEVGGSGGGDCTAQVAYLEISQDLRIGGVGTIRGTHCRNLLIPGEIKGSGKLTLDDGNFGGADLVVVGDIEIKVELVNKANVGVDHVDDTMILSTNPKSGTPAGLWYTTAGALIADAPVSGGAHWSVTDDQTALVRIMVASTNQTGTVTLEDGVFEVEANFCTQGSLHLDTPDTTTEKTKIKVHPNTSAKFAGACP